MPVIFEGCRLRIERAYANHVALAKAWNEIPAEDLYRSGAKVNPDGTGAITLTRPNPVSTIFSLQIGVILPVKTVSLN